MNRPGAGSAASLSAEPSRARYGVVGFAVALAVIQYVDRVCISQAAPFVSEDLALSPRQMGYVFSAFTLAYALFEIPAGYLGDRIGPRKVLLRIVLWWSFFTAATGLGVELAFAGGDAVPVRRGRGGLLPEPRQGPHRWLPPHERTRAQGLLWMSARWGGAATPLLVYFCLQHVHWRTAFLLFGLLGIAWAVAFFFWYRDDPRAHPAVNAAEAALVPGERSSRHRLTSACRGDGGCGRGRSGACAGSMPP